MGLDVQNAVKCPSMTVTHHGLFVGQHETHVLTLPEEKHKKNVITGIESAVALDS